MCSLKLNFDKDNSNDNHHHGFEPFLVSGLSCEAVAASCVLRDSVNVQEPLAEMAYSLKRD